jgi:hypothetical protein
VAAAPCRRPPGLRPRADAGKGPGARRQGDRGRALSARELFRQKQRFVQRWPERSYTVRPDTLRTACAPASETCTVHAVFDFIAVNPARGRRSTGSATLELVVDVSGPRPVIVAETSRIVSRGGVARLEGREDDSLENGDD